MILGEIFGLNAGLTCTECVLPRFLLPRAAVAVALAFLLLPVTEPVGEARALSWGLGMTELEALVSGALLGPILGVLRADKVGVVWSSLAWAVLMGGRDGRVEVIFVTGAGRVMSSTTSPSASARSSDAPLGSVSPLRLACFRSFISEAGVAGALSIGRRGADLDPAAIALRHGDLPAEVGRGVAGGGMRASDNGSGEIDSASELS